MRFQVPLPRPELRFRVPLTHTPSDTRAQVPLPQRTAKRFQICAVPHIYIWRCPFVHVIHNFWLSLCFSQTRELTV